MPKKKPADPQAEIQRLTRQVKNLTGQLRNLRPKPIRLHVAGGLVIVEPKPGHLALSVLEDARNKLDSLMADDRPKKQPKPETTPPTPAPPRTLRNAILGG